MRFSLAIAASFLVSFSNVLAQRDGDSGPENRRLILNGNITDISEHPFTVSLMICSLTASGRLRTKSCYHFCTGSLIAPDVVLTAGHCVVDDATPFNEEKPVTDLRRVRVLIGATDALNRPKGSRMVKVRDFANAGYNNNYHFPMDNDVGLLFLSQCLSPHRWALATVPTPERSLDGACQNAYVVGWGKHKSVPDLLYKTDGKLRSYVDRIQPYAVCRESYVDLHNGKVYKGLKQSIPLKELHNTISPDRHLCYGGNTPSSSCFGDSGGPITITDPESGKPVIIGVTSFGPTRTCGSTPSYAARVSTYASWIHTMIQDKSACGRFDISRVFTSYPVTERPQSPTDRTGRCGSGRWQCEYSGECIDARNVCDGYPQCDDGSDEYEHVCLGDDSAANTESIPPPIEAVAASMGLVMMEDVDMNMDTSEDGPVGDNDEEDDDDGSDEDSVSDDAVFLNTRLYSKWREEIGPLVINFSECPAVFALIEHIRDERCPAEYTKLVAGVKGASSNPRVAVTKVMLDSCEKLNECIGDPQNALLVAWVKHCTKAPLPMLKPPDWIRFEFQPHVKFCRSAQSFADEEAQRIPNAMKFARKYDGECPALPASR